MGAEAHERPLQRISTIHFLVHPGYMDHSPEYNHLLDKYLDDFAHLPQDEILVVLTHVPHNYMKEPLAKHEHKPKNVPRVVEKLKVLSQKLGKQVIVLSNDISPDEKAIAYIRGFARLKGYYFDAKTRTIACGEIVDACVMEQANALNKSGGFEEPTEIDLSKSDYDRKKDRGVSTYSRDRMKTDLLKFYPRIKLQE